MCLKNNQVANILIYIILFGHNIYSLPPKIDLGIILDTSSNMGETNLSLSVDFIKGLLDRLSISPGTTRVALYTINNKMKEEFHFRKHVNRECVIKAINNVTIPSVKRSKNFRSLLTKAFKQMHKKSKTVDDQRRVYLFITNVIGEYGVLTSELTFVLSKPDFMGLLLVNLDKETIKQIKKKNAVGYFIYNDKSDILNILEKLNIPDKSFTSCLNEGKTIYDECHRQCKCKNGKLKSCYRVRREFTAMPKKERRRYLNAYKILTTTSPYKEIYERYIYMHYKYFCWGIHQEEIFFPWHRWYISVMEDFLRQIDCRVTLSYWDWSYASNDPWNTNDLWSSTNYGLGGNGSYSKDYCVQNGMFREGEWETPYWEDPIDIILSVKDRFKLKVNDKTGHLAFCLRRAFNSHTPTSESVQRTLNIPPNEFQDFDIMVRHNYHNRVHNIIGGTMSTHFAANAPEFFLHHAFLDKIWYTWQKKSLKHKYVHFLQRNKTKMLGCEHTQRELIDTKNLPRCIKVKYSKFLLNKRFRRGDEIDEMGRAPASFWNPIVKKTWWSEFPQCKKPKAERKRAYYLHQKFDLGWDVDP